MATILGITGEGFEPVGKDGRMFVKDIIGVGEFVHPKTGEKISVTMDRLRGWVQKFSAVIADGYDVEATKDHSLKADGVVGYIKNMFIRGDRLFAAFEMNPDGQRLAANVKNVSVEIEPEWKKGDGKVYKDAISRVSIVQEPVINKQTPFE